MEPLVFWGWLFLAIYIAMMIVFGVVGMRRVQDSDNLAVARGSYSPVFLAFALVATTASGAAFLGLPGLAYSAGLSSLWYAYIYPFGVYLGVLVCLHAIRRAGENFGSCSMPEYLGDRFDSDFLRIAVAVFSMLLLFYLAAQLLAGAVMFNNMLGLDKLTALFVTAVVLMIYIALGGAHADILIDGVQGALMLLLAGVLMWMFFTGLGVDGGLGGMVSALAAQDQALTASMHPTHPLFNSWWDMFAIFAAHLPLGMLPHIGNKLWALKDDRDQVKFISIAFFMGLLLPSITMGGILARAVLGDDLLLDGYNPNEAIPTLFIATLLAWLAALIGAGVLAAAMSTADGLVVWTSQILANGIFRRSIAPRWMSERTPATIDHIALLVWAGVGGMMAASAGPMFLGVLWRRSKREGAIVDFFA